MARRAKVEAAKTRARILASALSLFVRRGYEKTTLTDIAARLQLTKGAVYWHFPTKESLLVALVEEMLEKFSRQIDERVSVGGLSFRAVAEMMVQNAQRIVESPKDAAFFMLMKTQVRWGADSMAKTREALLSSRTNSPYHVFVRAIEGDKARGLVRAGADSRAAAAACMAVWDGVVQSRIEHFLETDLADTLRKAYDAVWRSLEA